MTTFMNNLEQLSKDFETKTAPEILKWAFDTYPKIAISSSFGADAIGLLHMAVQIRPDVPIHFVNTGFLFPETLEYVERMKKLLNLNVVEFKTKNNVDAFMQQHPDIQKINPDFCCAENKVEPMQRALEGLDAWIAGLRRDQSKTRKDTPILQPYKTGIVKIHPIANWTSKQLHYYIVEHKLPFHPLYDQGYPSIGCFPCTRKPADPSDPRSGRWAGNDKTECGIHTFMDQEKA